MEYLLDDVTKIGNMDFFHLQVSRTFDPGHGSVSDYSSVKLFLSSHSSHGKLPGFRIHQVGADSHTKRSLLKYFDFIKL